MSREGSRFGARVGRTNLVVGSLLLAVLLLTVWPTLDNRFSLDDYNWLARARFRASTAAFILEPEPGQLFQPVARAFYLGLYRLGGEEPLVYRIGIVLLHALNTVLLWLLGTRLTGSREVGWLAALLFIAQPAYHEALFWIAAFFHPLATTFFLSACLLAVASGRRRERLRLALLGGLVLAGCLVKASFFMLPVILALLVWREGSAGPRREGWRPVAVAAAIVTVAVAGNLALGIADSYLLERGVYRLGPHLLGNLVRYCGRLLVPWDALLDRVGLQPVVPAVRAVAGAAGLGAAAILVLRGARQTRALAAATLATLVPFLPFVSEPTSRYGYLPSALLALLVAALVIDRWGASATRAAAWVGLVGLGLAAAADHTVRDYVYRYRERQMERWVKEVVQQVPGPLAPAHRLTILGLPTLAVDRGIHLEAALQLRYDNPLLELLTETVDEPPSQGPVLVFEEGRIRASRPPP